jgi:hypothetical protein
MGTTAAVLAALASTGFAVDLWRGHRARPRSHAAVWSVAIGFFALATWALALGLGSGWDDTSFRVFFYLGAIATVPVLALGSVYLAFGDRAGARWRNAVLAFLAAGAWVTMTAVPLTAVADVGVPEGSEVFEFPLNEVDGGASLPSPRLFAAVGTGLGATAILVLAARATAKTWRTNRRVAFGNLFIVAGTLAASAGGSLTALGEGGSFAVSLLAASVLLWVGYRIASGRRS